MANQQGFDLSAGVGAIEKLLAHFDRTKLWHENEDGTQELRYTYYPNQTVRGMDRSVNYSVIDAERTHLNYNLAPDREGGQGAFIERRLKEIYVHKSALKNGLVDWVVTLPDLEQYIGREREFFESSFDALCEKYGIENVVSAYVHMDEAQPHMHFVFIPVAVDEKHKEGWKLSKKAINTYERVTKGGKVKRDTVDFSRQFHAYLDLYVCQRMGFEVSGVQLTEEQRAKRKIKQNMNSVPELKEAVQQLETVEAETDRVSEVLAKNTEAANAEYKRWETNKAAADKAAQRAAEAAQRAAALAKAVDDLLGEKGRLEGELKAVSAKIEQKEAKLTEISDKTASAQAKFEKLEAFFSDLQDRIWRLFEWVKENLMPPFARYREMVSQGREFEWLDEVADAAEEARSITGGMAAISKAAAGDYERKDGSPGLGNRDDR